MHIPARLALLAALTGLVAGCGGDDNSSPAPSANAPAPAPAPSPAPAPAPAADATGRLVDAAVAGVSYDCGGVTGVTDDLGQFDYVTQTPAVECTFKVGDVTLGTVAAAPLLTPFSFVGGAVPGTPNATVTNIARLLQSLDSDGNPANGILIPAAAITALTGAAAAALDFSAAGFDAAAGALVAAAFPGRALVSAAAAEAHMDLTLLGLYAGSYSCTYSGVVGGVNTLLGAVAISISDGVVTGSGTPAGSTSTFTVGGTISSSGAANLSAGTTSTGATFQGAFTSDGTVAGTTGAGTWNDASVGSGTWSCSHN